MPTQHFFRLPVVSAGAEHLVMGYLMRRNILTYKAPPNNEGYDLICIHPDPRHKRKKGEVAQVRVQVKSRYATNCDRGFPVKEESLNAFDFLIVAFLNIGNLARGGENSGRPTYRIPLEEVERFERSRATKPAPRKPRRKAKKSAGKYY